MATNTSNKKTNFLFSIILKELFCFCKYFLKSKKEPTPIAINTVTKKAKNRLASKDNNKKNKRIIALKKFLL